MITGSARGKKLKSISNDKIRPTASVVKEATMNIIQFEIVDARILDLFAGTGQITIELLSRGAQSAVMVDINSMAIKMINDNLSTTNLSDKAEVVRASAETFLQSNDREFDIVFLDPPYGKTTIPTILPKITKFLGLGGIIVCETDKKDVLPNEVNGYMKSKDYIYGIRKINIYKQCSENA